MRVAILTETFSKDMGYLENCLPAAFARLGVEVHLVTMDLPPYYQDNSFKNAYGAFAGSGDLIPGKVEQRDGYTLHVLPHKRMMGYMRMDGLADKLKSIEPDVVQTMAAIGWLPLDAYLAKSRLGCKLFTGSHTASSTFPLASQELPLWNPVRMRAYLTRFLPGRLVSRGTEKCYAVTCDCGEIAWRFFGVHRDKVAVMHLGVDTSLFHPVRTEEDRAQRAQTRRELGFGEAEIVCIYTGKMTEVKNALILAEAIGKLRGMGLPFSGLFVGDGVQKQEIESRPHCKVLPFKPFRELPPYYRAADIGVWPTNESISMLDAAASGLPLVVSDGIVYRDHVEGNGLVCRLNDLDDLVRVLAELNDPGHRAQLGGAGAEKMQRDWSWDSVARRRLADYEAALMGA